MTAAPGARRPQPRVMFALSCTWIALILYGSWLPFDFDGSFLAAHQGTLLACFDWGAPGLEDALTNLVVYVPLGLLLAWRAALSGGGLWQRWLLPLLIGAATTAVAESLQVLLVTRVASLTDMLFNIMGTLLGLTLSAAARGAFQRIAQCLRRELGVRPMRALLLLGVTGVLFAKWAPFDLAVLPADFSASLRDARWDPFVPPSQATTDTMLQGMTDVAGSFFAFLAIGMLAALTQRESGESRRWSILVGATQMCFVAVGIEVVQLVIRSHTCDVGDMMTYMAGGWIGAVLGATTIDRAWRQPLADGQHKPAQDCLRMLLSTALMIQICLIVSYGMPNDEHGWVAPSIDSIQWLPFYEHFKAPFATGVGQMISSLMWYGVLATLAVAMVPQRGAAYSMTMSAFCTAGVVTATEVAQAFSVSRYADVTEPLLAVVAAAAATWAYYQLLHWRDLSLVE